MQQDQLKHNIITYTLFSYLFIYLFTFDNLEDPRGSECDHPMNGIGKTTFIWTKRTLDR